MIRKKHNMAKRLQTMAQATLKDVAIVMSLSATEGKYIAFNTKGGHVFIPGRATARTIAGCTFKWSYLLVVWSTESNGKERMITEFQRMAAPYRQETIMPYLNEVHTKLIHQEQDRGNAVFDAGYVAMPVADPDDDKAYSIMINALEQVVNSDKQRMAG